jgi:hypothetical protein
MTINYCTFVFEKSPAPGEERILVFTRGVLFMLTTKSIPNRQWYRLYSWEACHSLIDQIYFCAFVA